MFKPFLSSIENEIIKRVLWFFIILNISFIMFNLVKDSKEFHQMFANVINIVFPVQLFIDYDPEVYTLFYSF